MISTNFYIPPLLRLKSNLDLALSNQEINFEDNLVSAFRIQLHTEKIVTSTIDNENRDELFFKPEATEKKLKSFVIKQTGYIANFPTL